MRFDGGNAGSKSSFMRRVRVEAAGVKKAKVKKKTPPPFLVRALLVLIYLRNWAFVGFLKSCPQWLQVRNGMMNMNRLLMVLPQVGQRELQAHML
jgi:hypothetical protein